MFDERNPYEDLEICNKATTGPWINGSWNGRCYENHLHGKGNCNYQYTLNTEDDYSKRYVVTYPNITLISCDDYGPVLSENDAKFIAMSREALPYWIEKCLELEQKINRLEKENEQLKQIVNDCD